MRNRNRRARIVGRFAPDRAASRRVAAKAAKDEHQPGQTSGKLRRRMGDALADLFDEFGPEIYSETILTLKESILSKFQEGFEALDRTIKEELGSRGVKESRQHIRAWSDEIVEDVNHLGLDEVAGSLEDYVGTLAAEFQSEDAGEGDELLDFSGSELDDEEPEEVEEEEVEELDLDLGDEPAAEDPLASLDLDLEMPGGSEAEEAAAAAQPGFGPMGGRRRRPTPRRFRRQARREATSRKGRRFGRPFVRKATQDIFSYYAVDPDAPLEFSVDYENSADEWWGNGGEDHWFNLAGGDEDVSVEPYVATDWVAAAMKIPGWGAGPEYAPFPIAIRQENAA